MSTIIINYTDPHYSDRKPRSRKDDYQATQIRKTNHLIHLAKNIRWGGQICPASAITISGDICHQPRGELISRRLDIRLIETLAQAAPCPILAILGNHDKDRDRSESIDNHTLGILVASEIIKLVHWPEYQIVGTDPLVIVSGRQYTLEGPAAFLDHIRSTGQLRELKARLTQESGKKVFCFFMSHCNWGPEDVNNSDPIVGYKHVLGTGIDVMALGHPHSDDGIVELDDSGRLVRIVGPGAFTRGTIAEGDINRQPKIAVAVFHSDKENELVTVAIPHEPADQVFDVQAHTRVKQNRIAEEKFVQALAGLEVQAKTPEEILATVANTTPPGILARSRQYYTIAESMVSQ